MKILFVGGVHGVGKSTSCGQVAARAGCVHATASDIIRKQKTEAIAASGKRVTDVDGNQKLLIQGFHSLRASVGSTPILLDGHFALRDSSGRIQTLSCEVFASLGVNHLVCLIDDAAAIASRVSGRDGHESSVEEIRQLQSAELDNAKLIATALQIPLTVLCPSQIERLATIVNPP